MPIFSGRLLRRRDVTEAWLEVEGGRIVATGKGHHDDAVATGWIVPGMVDAHTHVADAFLQREDKPRDVAALVGPGGWKHQRLATADPRVQALATQAHTQAMAAGGTASFIDFREGGLAGVRWLRGLDLAAEPVIYGRPSKPTFDEDEAEALMAEADGIGLSGLRDIPSRVLRQWSDACHDAQVPFAFHASEDARDDIDQIVSLAPHYVVHMTQARPSDFETLADERIPIIACPRSNAWFGMRTPLATMLEAGCTVALGTDNAMLHAPSMLDELALARHLAPSADVAHLLRVATYHGRDLAGLPDPEFRKGAPADWIVLPGIPEPQRRKPGLEPNLDPEAWR